jgi:putative serine protease PepD
MECASMSRPPLAATLATAAVVIGVGSGAATYAALSSRGTKTIVRQVTVASAQPTANTSALSINSVYRRAYKGVVKLTVSASSTGPFGGSQSQQAEGSGFVYDTKGHIVTNAHVAAGASAISVKFWNGATYSAHLVGSDASTDLAVIKVDAPASVLVPLTLGDSDKVVVGDGVVAIGSPFGLDETVTAGIVSALHRQMTSPNNFTIDDSIQTDAAINHGNSGGPLLNLLGEVIGVNAQIASDSGGNNGVGFAIPSNTVRSAVTQLLANGTVKHAYLGVTLGTSTQVGSVPSGTPAAKAGLRAGDVITALDSKPVGTGAELRSVINGKQPGDSISVTYTRGGSSHTVQLTLASRPK